MRNKSLVTLFVFSMVLVPFSAFADDPDSVVEFSVMTWNVHEFPSWWENENEYLDIAAYITNLHPQVVGTQELFIHTPNLYSILTGRLVYHYLNCIEPIYGTNLPPDPIDCFVRLGNGLATFSDFPISGLSEVRWNDCHGCPPIDFPNFLYDCLAKKGFTRTTLMIPVNEGNGHFEVDFYNLHTDAGKSELDPFGRDEETRRAQFEQLSDFMDSFSKGKAAIVVGDFNLHKFSVSDVITRDWFKDTQGLEQCCPNDWFTNGSRTEKFDYILYRGGGNSPGGYCVLESNQNSCDVLYDTDLSDHYPVLATIRIIRGIFADFDYVKDGLTVNFEYKSESYNCDIVSWEWSFGDGTTSTEKNPVHTYESSGYYTAVLTVENEFGESDFKANSIEAIPLNVNSPNGGEFWAPGNTEKIEWSYYYDGGIPDKLLSVKLELLVDNSPLGVIASSLPIHSGYYDWVVGEYMGGTAPNGMNYKIKITANEDTSVFDLSNQSFSILDSSSTPIINVTTPEGGEEWRIGNSYVINWATMNISDGANMNIKLIQNNNKYIGEIVNSTPNTGTYIWTLSRFTNGDPVEPGDNYYIRVKTNIDSETIEGFSNTFTIIGTPLPTIKVTYPASGETYYLSSPMPIEWTTVGITGDVSIDLRKSDDSGGYNITPATPYNSSPYNYTIPVDVTPGTYFIRIAQGTTIDESGVFTIAEIPAGEMVFTLYPATVPDAADWTQESNIIGEYDGDKAKGSPSGTTFLVATDFDRWTLPAGKTITKVEYGILARFTDGASGKARMKEVTHNEPLRWLTFGLAWDWKDFDITALEAAWTKAEVDALQVAVKRADDEYDENPNVNLRVGGIRLIVTVDDPGITVTSPNGGENWELGSTHNVTWNAQGLSNNLKITLWQDDSNLGIIGYDIDPAAGSYPWTVGQHNGGTASIGTGYKIKIKEISTTVSDFSDQSFSIVEEEPPQPETFTLYPTTVPNAANWTQESNIIGEYDGNKAEGWPEGTTFLVATNFDNWTLPAGKVITKVEYGILARFTDGVTGKARMKEITHGEIARWITFGTNWYWRDFDITSLEASWTKVEVDALQVAVKRAYADDPADANLRVGGIRLKVTVQ